MSDNRSCIIRLSRRRFVHRAGIGSLASASLVLLAACGQQAGAPTTPSNTQPTAQPHAQTPSASVTGAPTAASKSAGTAAPTSIVVAPTATAAGNSGPIRRGNTLNVAVQNDWVTMWPVLTTGPTPYMCYDWLVAWRRGSDGQWGPQPELATSWELSEKAVTFKLRQGITFHDGSPLDPDVVKWNVETMVTHPRSVAKTALAAIDAEKPAEVVDDHTIRINLKYADGSLLSALSDGEATTAIVSKAAHDKLGDDGLAKHPVGTGPFIFESWQPQNQLVVNHWDKYWQTGADGKPKPYIDKIVYQTIQDDSVRTLDMESGHADFTELIRASDIPNVKADAGLVYDEADWMVNRYRLVFNSTNAPFKDNLKLRQAVLYSIDREALAKALGLGVGIPSKYDFTSGELGYDDSLPYYRYDAAKATQLVKEAGYPNGVTVTLTAVARQVDSQQAQLLQQMLGQVGIKMNIDSLDGTAWKQKVRQSNDFQMVTQRSGTPYDPDPDLTLVWASSGTAAYSRAKIPEMDAALADARSSYDPKVRAARYYDCQKIMYNTAWWGFLWTQPWNYVYGKQLKGVPAIWATEYQRKTSGSKSRRRWQRSFVQSK
jgi:ABC-type transport system substrate-binding protein